MRSLQGQGLGLGLGLGLDEGASRRRAPTRRPRGGADAVVVAMALRWSFVIAVVLQRSILIAVVLQWSILVGMDARIGRSSSE
ncbi:hypothetical protein [Brachybacterium nesterenkovii]|uniref:hypothetical protein n=1 Tax=Brachybacterium nesterenkovii TaxID=47847 RepID=UPI00321A52BC